MATVVREPNWSKTEQRVLLQLLAPERNISGGEGTLAEFAEWALANNMFGSHSISVLIELQDLKTSVEDLLPIAGLEILSAVRSDRANIYLGSVTFSALTTLLSAESVKNISVAG